MIFTNKTKIQNLNPIQIQIQAKIQFHNISYFLNLIEFLELGEINLRLTQRAITIQGSQTHSGGLSRAYLRNQSKTGHSREHGCPQITNYGATFTS